MPTKEEYNSIFNKLFGLDLDWTRMRKEDLAQLAVLLSYPETFLENLGVSSEIHQKEARRRFGGAMFEAADWLKERGLEGPVLKALRKLVED